MLVLSRKNDEGITIMIDDKILKIKVLNIEGNAIKLGFEGPREFKIYREEVYESIMKENISATKVKDVSQVKKLFNKK
ncbi:carbon storage regulator, CsrA [Marinitoga hydrogenitolerans DSM 16785]|uniref:Translational regulator CsrA n=1 Tax=Marinitoga hydrogenitolerans (strain DSM 16785 / JCM 12826 / AT1271) TaxID=1122195 RepID=A0A1M4V2U2_MARH1|nr:carbon storage regulator [Marinitoga hydrogenitolerans]SHE63311.1 carbon storage regulator, CsrA [Marinitoga hydrogenitolerans DSM 16785]